MKHNTRCHVQCMAMLGLVLLTLLTGCTTNPATGRSQLILLSSSQIAAMGDAAAPEMVESYGGELPDSSVRSYVRNVGASLADQTEAEYADTPWTFTVLDSDVINAFALPPGNVYVSRGLLQRLGDEAELAGVLGHEIGHVTARHVDERLSHASILAVGTAVLAESTDSEIAQLGILFAGQGYTLKFGRDQELEADGQGLKYMSRVGYDPAAMISVMEVLKSAAGGGTIEFLSTHPDPDRRIEAIEAALAGTYANTQGNPAFQRHESRFQREVIARIGGPATASTASQQHLASAWCSVCADRAGGQVAAP